MNDALPTLPQPNFISCPYCENWQKLYSNWLGFCNLTDQLKSHALVGVQSQSVSLSQCLIAQTERSVLTKSYFTLSVRVNSLYKVDDETPCTFKGKLEIFREIF